ncbi:Xylulose kinase (plasmid) [Sulfitobacter indolifex]|uniref:xylulokinase n=1 Tax=Sulfitobacter indolifex TaxID=225422 RepID=UPI001FADA7B5|nr:xylulokinase [Sulfitobacter indolifex]UOA20661.1 Xylulose kinase [Sulfitobacter indolifex]
MTYLGLDLGTSGVKALLIDVGQNALAEGHAPLQVQRPHPLWSEQDPQSWIAACEAAIAQVRAAAPAEFAALRGISVSGQMHGATLLDASDQPLRPAILWNDGRSHAECAELEARADFRGIGGNIVMAGFTAPKLRWVQKHEPEIFAQLRKVLLPKDYVGLWLTGEHVSEMSDAAGTLWLDVAKRDWSDELLTATDLTRDHMPRLIEGSARAGGLRSELAAEWGVSNVTIAGGAGDNAATAVGLGLVQPGQGFLSLGTSGVLFSVTDRFASNIESAVHSFCHAVPETWHQMGVILSATDALAWLGQIAGQSPATLARMVKDVTQPSPITFLPYLSGERTPHNAPNATSAFQGLRREHELPDMVQAVMEGVGFAFADCCRALEQCGSLPERVCVAGGGSQSETWLQMIADITGLTLDVPESGAQGAALGAARLAVIGSGDGVGTGVIETPKTSKTIVPNAALMDSYANSLGVYRAAFE